MSNGTFKVRVTGREYNGTTKGAKRSLIAHLQAQRLPEVRVLHRPGEPRPAGRRERLQPRRAADQLRQPQAHGARRPRLHRDPVPGQRRHQRPAAHQRREPAGLRHAALRPRDAQGRQPGHDRLDRGLAAPRPATSPTAAAPRRRRSSAPTPTSSRSTPRRSTCRSPTRSSSPSPPPAGGVLRPDDHPSQEQHDGCHQLRDRFRRHHQRRRLAGQRRALRRQQRRRATARSRPTPTTTSPTAAATCT